MVSKLFSGNRVDYNHLFFSFACSLGIHVLIICLVCFFSLDRPHVLPLIFKREMSAPAIPYVNQDVAIEEKLPIKQAQELAKPKPALESSKKQVLEPPAKGPVVLDNLLPEELVSLFAQWEIFPVASSVPPHFDIAPCVPPQTEPVIKEQKIAVIKSVPKAAKKNEPTKKASPQKIQKVVPKKTQKSQRRNPCQSRILLKNKHHEYPPSPCQKNLLGPKEQKKKYPDMFEKKPITHNMLVVQKKGDLKFAKPGREPLSEAENLVQVEFTDVIPSQGITPADADYAITHDIYETIKQAWEPLAGWEEAGPVIISVEPGNKVAHEPQFVTKSYAAAKNQQAMSIARFIVQSGKSHGRKFNLTFK